MPYHILIAEDDEDIVELLRIYLENAGYTIYAANNGEDAYRIFLTEKLDMLILDIMMPRMNGYELTKKIRETSNIPILILSAKNEDMDKITGLNLGADDYMVKPFNPLEIIARAQSGLRRYYKLGSGRENDAKVISSGGLTLDTDRMTLTRDGAPISLTATEFRLLSIFMRSPGQVFTKAQLYEKINGEYFENDDSTMMVHISNLRDKIEKDSKDPRYIKTVRGVGYKFEKL